MATIVRKETLLNVSTSPHIRSPLNTQRVMLDVIISLLPAAVLGVINLGVSALAVIACSIVAAVASEAAFCAVTKRKQTIGDLSAAVTGLLLALCLPASVPLYIPILGAVFAVLFVKCFFGGLGKNIMNPALVGRCFLLIAFGAAMTSYSINGVTSATPLAMVNSGEVVDAAKVFLGQTSGCIGNSALGLIIGGAYLLLRKGITWEIPVISILSFALFVGIFGQGGFDPEYLAIQVCGGGILLGGIFMATDPVTCPVTSGGQMVFGLLVGILAGLFRVKGTAADSVSYAIIMSNMLVPFIDMLMIPKPYAYRAKKEKVSFPKPALVLAVIALVSGLVLSALYTMTKENIAAQQLATKEASYREVCSSAQSFDADALQSKVDALNGEVYGGGAFGKAYINEAIVGKDASGNDVGYVISVTSGDGYKGNITMSLGIAPDGSITGLAYTDISESPGLGMECDKPAFKDQFNGLSGSVALTKDGGVINQVSGATFSSRASTNAVSAALDFFAQNIAK